MNDTNPRRVDLLVLRRLDRHFRILLLLAHCSVARARCIPTLGRLMRESSLFAPALVKQDAVSPAEGVGASDVERRVVDKVQIRDGRWRGRDMREGFVEECCVCEKSETGGQRKSVGKEGGRTRTNRIRACKKSRRRRSHMIRRPQRTARFPVAGVPAWRASRRKTSGSEFSPKRGGIEEVGRWELTKT